MKLKGGGEHWDEKAWKTKSSFQKIDSFGQFLLLIRKKYLIRAFLISLNIVQSISGNLDLPQS